MTITLSGLQEYKEYKFKENINFDERRYADSYLKKIDDCIVYAKCRIDNDLIFVDLSIECETILTCAYTLSPINYHLNCQDELTFTYDKNKVNEEIVYLNKTEIELDDYILAAIIASIPTKVTKKGATLPKGGEGYRVISQEQYEEENSHKKNSAFDVLDKLDIE